ncbi:adenylate/guanylate cyclase domain-containing protein [Altererythrobacter sp. H2]|uniref:adenylate/guanylate cyclase domain-containing protein n=1 Tax=Altererythrobacter sp. H2 TaxID=3108391 RepID=UPI002B4C14AA|nr:adenylate/guanylate cyclase domain-containing protein [Altererythrobacter sp. H2]WRK95696.1 adenylate/guanylate cyclase domain-containing protein [Altererythrobacter sp. H2]
MSDERTPNFIVRGWRNVREAGPRRLALTGVLVLVALAIARFGWVIPGVADAERAMYDSRSYVEADRNDVPQDNRVVMVVFTDQTLINAGKRSPLDRGIIARALQSLDGMGAKAIGIDILFDQPQAEDEELIATLRAMQTPVVVGYVDTATNEDNIKYEQEQYLKAFLAQLEGSRAVPGSVKLSDSFGVTRLWPEQVAGQPDLLGRAMLKAAGEGARTLPGYQGAVRYRLPEDPSRPVFTYLPIDTFSDPELTAIPELSAALAEQVEGRYVLIGGDIVDVDRLTTPLTQAMGTSLPPGIEFHATSIAQMLDGKALPRPMPLVLWVLSALVVVMAVLTGLLEWGNWRIYLLLAVQFVVMLGVPFVMQFQQTDTYGVPAVGWLLGWIAAFMAVTSAARASGAVQRNFAQGALGKYLPREMAQEIIDNPKLLALHGEKKQIFVLFSDLEGFTKMSHAVEPEMVALLINRYLEMLSQVVLDHGGVIDKFIGDAVVAFWGAPIARPDDGERAARCGYAMWQAGEAFRAEVAAMDPNLPKIGKTRVGLHFGEAVVGNFGGDNRIQYTALGDSMNTAARLESANKPLQSSVMASREFVEKSSLDWWRPMGTVILRGRAKPVDLFEPAPDFPDEDRKALIQASILMDHDRPQAEQVIAGVVARHPQDKALANLLDRVQDTRGGSAYVLG